MLEGKSLTPTENRLMLRLEPRLTMERGFYIPDISQTANQRGHVVACGPEVLNVTDGMVVITPPRAGTRLIVAGVEYLIIRESDALACEE